ncbi:ATP-grasp domain-containing protein [Kitasatospora sp. NBC_01287]|uniref:ATP-grasp domain-containing protein n=1 Tax=Kitasatospora sp. NBC_01287 TaxID=2903573 RepID=UPI00224CCDBF|nr:ATP-grasp domain-containing protein [Kitasatospora sp. NBC_01287]MCX4746931.1 ATP-grasp domain-containing protein [Kitasatospora sp. NBC_01287]
MPMINGTDAADRCLVLVLRKGFTSLGDHLQTLLDLAVRVHLVTVESPTIADDPRFTSVVQLPESASHREFVDAAVGRARETGAAAVFTLLETDIEIAETANAEFGNGWATPEAAFVCRDKFRQREFLRQHGIPSVWYHPVTDIDKAVEVAAERGFPLILKPTRAAASEFVELVQDADRLRVALDRIKAMIDDNYGFYYEGEPTEWALLEEYLPGQEVTLDGVVVGGRFILGGVHNKLESSGPYFLEDLYTLPYTNPEREDELADIAARINTGLGTTTCMFNAELRQGADGAFRVVEFSIRVSGGHPYRHIKDVYSIDLLRMFVRAACGEPVDDILAQENRRSEPRMTVCAKVVYSNGTVVRNSVGEAIHSPHFRVYFATAKPGRVVAAGTQGFDATGLLSVWMPWQPGQDPSVVHNVAKELAQQLDIDVRDEAGQKSALA